METRHAVPVDRRSGEPCSGSRCQQAPQRVVWRIRARSGARFRRNAAGSAVAPDISLRLHEAFPTGACAGGRRRPVAGDELALGGSASLACLNYALRRCADRSVMALATLRDEKSRRSPLMDGRSARSTRPRRPDPARAARTGPHRSHGAAIGRGRRDVVPLLHQETAGNPSLWSKRCAP